MYVCIYICVMDKLEQSVHAVKKCQTILAPESLKSVSVQKGRRPIEWFWNGPRRHKHGKRGQKLDWH